MAAGRRGRAGSYGCGPAGRRGRAGGGDPVVVSGGDPAAAGRRRTLSPLAPASAELWQLPVSGPVGPVGPSCVFCTINYFLPASRNPIREW